MNSVELIGRLARDPDIRQGQTSSVATFTLAVDRNDKDKNTDFPRVVCFGNTANFVGQYLKQGRLISVQGRLQTGSYTNKKGDTVYTTDVVAYKVEARPDGSRQNGGQQSGQYQNNGYQQTQYQQPPQYQQQAPQYQQGCIPPNFEEVDGDVPY